jgi:hypothetical protein
LFLNTRRWIESRNRQNSELQTNKQTSEKVRDQKYANILGYDEKTNIEQNIKNNLKKLWVPTSQSDGWEGKFQGKNAAFLFTVGTFRPPKKILPTHQTARCHNT